MQNRIQELGMYYFSVFFILEKYVLLGSMLWSQFSAIFDNLLVKKLAFFSKTYIMIKILHNSALIWAQNTNFFTEFFGDNILKS
jgi:hypothetical protein